MQIIDRRPVLGLLAALAVATPLSAQRPPARPAGPPANADSLLTRVPENGQVKLVYEREVFSYPSGQRRDPFTPLTGENRDQLGPRFEELSLRGIIFSPIPSRSMALLVDQAGKLYRVRRGDLVGNAKVTSIQPLQVIFEVETFGVARQEQLDLKHANKGGQS